MKKRLAQTVLIVVENLPVPFDTRVWKEALALYENGYEVCVICPKGKGFEKSYELLDGVHIYRHPMPTEGTGPIGFIVEYSSALFWEFVLACKVFAKHKFNVIEGCNPPDTIFLVAWLFKLFGVKYIFDHHDVMPELYEEKFGRKDFLYKVQVFMEKLTFWTADVSMATNNTYKEIACSRGGMNRDDVFVVRNGPNLDYFNPVPAVPARKYGKDYLIGYVGNMGVQEGIDILLEVADFVKKSGRNDVHFTIIGGGAGLAQLRELNVKMGTDDVVDFTGRVSDEDLLEILSTADVCVNPDRPGDMNDMSTMIKIMEYMALEKPIVQFDLKEGKFSAGDASLYADSQNQVESFAEKILWLLDNPEERQKMGKLGRERVETELAWEYSVPHLLSAYERALNK